MPSGFMVNRAAQASAAPSTAAAHHNETRSHLKREFAAVIVSVTGLGFSRRRTEAAGSRRRTAPVEERQGLVAVLRHVRVVIDQQNVGRLHGPRPAAHGRASAWTGS